MTDMDPQKSIPEYKEWSDQRCFIISKLDTFPEVVRDTNIQKNIISRFLNFYLGGKSQKGLIVTDLIYAVISIMPASLNSEELFFDVENYSEKGTLFYLTPDDKLKVEIENLISKNATSEQDILSNSDKVGTGINNEAALCNDETATADYDNETVSDTDNINDNSDQNIEPSLSETSHSSEKPNVCEDNSTKSNNGEKDSEADTESDKSKEKVMTVKDLQWFRLKYDKKSDVSSEEYGPVTNAAFCIACNKILDKWESNVNGRIALKYFFAMAALTVMRCRVKTYQNVIKYFSTSFYKNIAIAISCVSYTIPHRGFIKKSWKAFRESDHRTQIMFSKLVINSFVQHEKLCHFGITNILRFAVLSHTADYGMGVISMLQVLGAQVGMYYFKFLFESLYSEELAVSWERVNNFFKKYLCKSAKQYTFHWARVIESEQFEYLSCSNNYGFAVVLAVFVEKITNNSGIWRSAWVNNGDMDSYKQLGHKLYNDYCQRKEELNQSCLSQMFIRL